MMERHCSVNLAVAYIFQNICLDVREARHIAAKKNLKERSNWKSFRNHFGTVALRGGGGVEAMVTFSAQVTSPINKLVLYLNYTRISQRRGALTPKAWGANILFDQFFLKTWDPPLEKKGYFEQRSTNLMFIYLQEFIETSLKSWY